MNRIHGTAGIAALLTTALCALGGASAALAAGSPPAAAQVAPGPAAAQARPGPALSGTEHIQLVSTSGPSTLTAIAGGVFTAGGVYHQGSQTATVVFPGGTYTVDPSQGIGPQTFNPRTCLLTVSQHGTFRVYGGTGKYAGISGSGTYRVSLLEVEARSGGKCSQNEAPVAYQEIVTASGPVRLPSPARR